jgi:hypothetical protein
LSIGGQKVFLLNQTFGEGRWKTKAAGWGGVVAVAANNYWSSSTNLNNATNAWNVNFNNGNLNNNHKTNNNRVRCVRGKKVSSQILLIKRSDILRIFKWPNNI